MKLIYSIPFLILSNLAAANSCNYLLMSTSVMTEVAALAKDVKQVSAASFDKKFCAALKACGIQDDDDEMTPEQVKKQTLNQFKLYPVLIETTEKKLAEAKAEALPEDPIKKKILRKYITELEKKLPKLKESNEKYQAFLKDPKIKLNPKYATESYIPIPTKELLEQSMNYTEMYYKNLPASIATVTKSLEKFKKTLEDFKAQTPPNESQIKQYETFLSSLNTSLAKLEEGVKLYEEYKKDPETKDLPSPYGDGVYSGYGQNIDGDLDDEASWLTEEDLKEPAPKKPDEEDDKSCVGALNLYESAVSTMGVNKSGSCGMRPEEISALKFYSDSGYGCMNGYLRQKAEDRDKAVEPLIAYMNSGLAKIPSYKGLVRRGGNLPQAIRDQHKVGEVVTYDAYTSTSTKVGFPGQDLFMMYSSQGKPIMGFSDHTSEYEVLFPAGAQFKILDVKQKNGVNSYIMKEVAKDATPEEMEKADKALLEVIKAKAEADQKSPEAAKTNMNSFDGNPGDTYMCPLDQNEALPKSIIQKSAPSF